MEFPRFHLVNEDVCIRLLLYGQDINNLLLQNNWKKTENIKTADLIFINTCSFIKRAEDRAVAQIDKIIKNKESHQEIVVFGCLPDINPERLKEIHQGTTLSGRNLKEVIETCREVTGHPIPTEDAPKRPGDPAILIASSDKIKQELGWQPNVSIEEGLARTFKWYIDQRRDL